MESETLVREYSRAGKFCSVLWSQTTWCAILCPLETNLLVLRQKMWCTHVRFGHTKRILAPFVCL